MVNIKKEILKIRFEHLELHYEDRIRAILKNHEEVVRLRTRDKNHFDDLEANLRGQIIALTHQLTIKNQEKGLNDQSKTEPYKIGETSVVLHDEGIAVQDHSRRFFDDPRILNMSLHNRKKRQQQPNSVCSKNNHCISPTPQCTFFFPDHPDGLSPFPVGYDRTKKKGEPNPQPPSSCGDLYRLGHTLAGFYIVQGSKDNNVILHAIIYCTFPATPNITGKLTRL